MRPQRLQATGSGGPAGGLPKAGKTRYIYAYQYLLFQETEKMPTYEYECKSCNHKFEVFQNMSEAPLKTCPKCGKGVRRLIGGGAGIIFKGSGFYVTDNKKNSAGGAGAAKKSADTETKSAEASSAPAEKTGKPEKSGSSPKEKKETPAAAKNSA
jgi:putative FmdB family regulatory protein